MTWSALSAADKATAVRQSIEIDGLTYSQAATIHGTTRVAIAGVASRARDKGQRMFKPITLKPAKPRSRPNPAVTREKAAKARHQGFNAYVPLDEPIPAIDATPLKPGAWDALPGTTPVSLDDRTGCCWPIGRGSPFLFCNEPRGEHHHWCDQHVKIGTRVVAPGTSERRPPKALKERKGLTS